MRKQLYKWGCAGRGPALMAAAVLLGGTLLGACSGSGTEGTGTAAAPGESGPRGGETRGMEDSDGSFNAEGLPILNEPETFTIAVPQRSSLKAAGEKLAAVEAAAATNVHIEWIEIPESGWKEKINIMFSTDSLPDAILGDVDMARNFEQLVVLDEYLASFAPAVTAFFETRDDYPNALRAPDGTIRTLPAGDESIHNIIDSQIWINQKWLDTLGLSMPESTQELKAVLTAFRDLDPNGNGIKDEVPFTFKKSWGWGGTIENMFGYFGVVENGNHVFVKDGRVIFSAREQGYYDALSYLHDLYREGLIDRDVFTISDDQYAARGSAGDTLGMVAGYRAEEAGVLTESDYRALPVLKSGTADGVVGLNNVTREGGFVITNSCKNPQALVRWYDYINSSLEQSLKWGRGAEGVFWEIVMENGVERPKFLGMDEAVLAANGGYKSRSEYRSAESFAGSTPSLWRLEYVERLLFDESLPYDYKLEAVKSQIPYGVKGLPAGTATVENAEKRSILKADMDAYLEKFIADSVLNGIDETKWQAHLGALESLKVEEYTNLCQEYTDFIK